MDIDIRAELWFATTGATYADQEVRELLNDAAAEIERLRRELELSRAVVSNLRFRVNEEERGF